MKGVIKILLAQHVGAPCKPIVKVGDAVKKGQLIATPEGLGANIHSSMYGTVQSIDEKAITIEISENQPSEYVKIKDTSSNLEAVKEAGIVGAGGAGFPAHIKFNVDLDGGAVIANAAECEPVLAHNVKFMEDHPEALVRGLKYIVEMTNASKAYIAIKEKNKKAVEALKKALVNETNIEIFFISNMYPAGDERVVIREISGTALEPGQLPSTLGFVVSNVETIKRVLEAIEDRKPFICKDITVAGRVADCVNEPRVFIDEPIGFPTSYYIEKCGGFVKPYGEIVLGGPFTGAAVDEAIPTSKKSGGILVSMPFPSETRKVGVIACECGADTNRLKAIAAGMGAEVVAEERCKRMVLVGERYRCERPGECPGQAEKVLNLKKQDAEVIITGTCED